MSFARRSQSSSVEDDDSHNYLDTESDTLTDHEPSDVSEYNYKDAVYDAVYSRHTPYFVFCALSFLTSVLFWSTKIPIVVSDGVQETISLRNSMAIVGCLGAFSFFLGYITESLCQKLLKGSKSHGTVWYYSSELAYFMSISLVLGLVHFYLFRFYNNFYIKNQHNFQLTAFDFLRISLGTIAMLGCQKAIVKRISMGFNYNTYIGRIRKCIFLEFFISIITNINEFKDNAVITGGASEQPVVVTQKPSVYTSFCFLFQGKFKARNAEDLSFSAKRVLIKEFQNYGPKAFAHSDNLPAVLWKIKTQASRRAARLSRKLIQSDKVECVGDLKKIFADEGLFDYFLDQVGLDKTDKIERDLISYILEKANKDKYVVSRNIEQINAAINRVAFCVRVFTYLLAVLTAYITATGEINTAVGIISAIFGTQFVANMLSDSILQSLIFLFVIHPFDIGDRVLIKLDGEDQNMVVSELNVFSTLFYRWDGTSLFVPNRVLAHTPISNIRRSGSVMECHSIQVNSKTDPGKIAKLRKMLIEFCKEHRELYTDYVLVNYERIEDANKLHLKVLMQYQGNWQHYESYLKKKSRFVSELNRCVHELKITYTLPVQTIKMKHPSKKVTG